MFLLCHSLPRIPVTSKSRCLILVYVPVEYLIVAVDEGQSALHTEVQWDFLMENVCAGMRHAKP